jgi:hypothetical protein
VSGAGATARTPHTSPNASAAVTVTASVFHAPERASKIASSATPSTLSASPACCGRVALRLHLKRVAPVGMR